MTKRAKKTRLKSMITDKIKADYAATLATLKAASNEDEIDYAIEHLLCNAHRWLIQLRLDAIAYRRKIEEEDWRLAEQLHHFEAIQAAAQHRGGDREQARAEAAGFCELIWK